MIMAKIDSFETIRLPEYVPEQIDEGKIYAVIGTRVADHSGPSVTYKCPCGCRKEVFLPCRTEGTERTRTPQWELSIDPEGKVVITPSILELGGCKSHYFIKHGRVNWA